MTIYYVSTFGRVWAAGTKNPVFMKFLDILYSSVGT